MGCGFCVNPFGSVCVCACGICVRQAVCGLMIKAVDICFVCMWMRFYEQIEITVNPSV